MRGVVLVLVGCMLLLGLPLTVEAEVLAYRGEQTLFTDTVWDGEILIDGILTVAPGVTLEIRPGSRVRFTRFDSNGDGVGEHELFSQGTVLAIGTEQQPILFSSAEAAPRRGDWGALNMMVSEQNNRLVHCRIEYGYRGFHAHFSRASLSAVEFRHNLRGAQFQESHVVIDSCRFIDNGNGVQFRNSQVEMSNTLVSGSHWGVRCVYSDVVMRNCTITDNLINGLNMRDGNLLAHGNRIVGNRRGLYLQRSRGDIRHNRLADNSEHGIFLEDSKVELTMNLISGNGRSGVRWLNSEGRVAANRICDNGVYALINDGTTQVLARNNWWGTDDLDLIGLAVRDGQDRPGAGPVDFSYPLVHPLPGSSRLEQQ